MDSKMIIYVDLDGVIVNTSKYIREELTKKRDKIKYREICESFPWDLFLKKCTEINNSFECLKKISQKYKVVILTHIYSDFEAIEKKKYIESKLPGTIVITVPKNIKKDKYVEAKNNILIDDYLNNIISWNNAGGYGIYFNENDDRENSIVRLDQIFSIINELNIQ